jgi:GNAT superfamily N-acetyltransferase
VDGLVFRTPTVGELDDLMRVELSAWPPGQQFSRANFESQLDVFNDGMICACEAGSMVGMFVVTRVHYDKLKSTDWYAISDDGDLRATFAADGPDVYGVSLSVAAEARGRGIGSALVREAVTRGRVWGGRRFLVGARMPWYSQHTDMSPEAYVRSGSDPQVEFYQACGLQILEVMPGYFHDPESLDFGVLMGVQYSLDEDSRA